MNEKTLYNTIDFCNRVHQEDEGNGHIEFHAAEPMMLPISFYECAEKRFKDIDCKIDRVICSNMTLATDEWFDFIQENEYGISTSLDGDIFINDINMGNGAFEKIIKSMAEMKKRKIDFGCIAVLSEYACDHVEEFYPFFHYMNQSIKLNVEIPNSFQEKTARAMIKIFDDWFDHKSTIRIDPFDLMIRSILYDENNSSCHKNCAKYVVCVDTKGDVYPCECFVLNDGLGDDYVFGNVNTDTFDEIWYSKNRMKFLQYVYNLHDDCKTCDYVDYCSGGCAADSIAIGNGNGAQKKGSTCFIIKTLMDHITNRIGWMKCL